MMPYRYHTVDVFTDTAFGGNQLAVLPDAAGLSDDAMAAITREFNFSETVFVFPPEDKANTRRVRIFTPGKELPFAGHPTVGTAFVLAACGEIELSGDETRIILEEGVGPVPVLIRAKGGRPFFTQLSAAKLPEKIGGVPDRAGLATILSLALEDIDVDGDLAVEGVSAGVPFLFVPVKDAEALGRARPRPEQWARALEQSPAPEVYIFTEDAGSASRNGMRKGDGTVRARMFAPTVGIPEDPATGGAAAAFAGYLAWRSIRKDGTLNWTIHQGVEMGRASRLEVEADVEGGEVKAVRVGGASVLISSGILHVP